MAASAADDIGELWHLGLISQEQEPLIVRSLLDILGRGGHWWRFGWDEDEPDFNRFRGVATDTVARLGPAAVPAVIASLDSGQRDGREAACWILGSMLAQGALDVSELDPNVTGAIARIAQNDPCRGVRAACSYLYNELH